MEWLDDGGYFQHPYDEKAWERLENSRGKIYNLDLCEAMGHDECPGTHSLIVGSREIGIVACTCKHHWEHKKAAVIELPKRKRGG